MAGGFRDTPAGRRSYAEFLEWLSTEPQEQKDRGIHQMSKGWALGSRDFKKALIEEHKSRIAEINLSENEIIEARKLYWEEVLERILSHVSPTKRSDSKKSADWRVAAAAIMKQQTTASNPWLARRLEMGSPYTLSRLVSECRKGTRAVKEFQRLTTKSKI